MPQKRYKPEQIINKLREAEVDNHEHWDYLFNRESYDDTGS